MTRYLNAKILYQTDQIIKILTNDDVNYGQVIQIGGQEFRVKQVLRKAKAKKPFGNYINHYELLI